jgi:exopolyphosphatase / guanosine-5'-triphosphate,3'-diphosphate pyrophosphatase
MANNRLAAIDIGTNSFHLVIAEVNPETGMFKILEREREMVRLGSSAGDMKYLSGDAIERGVETLKRFKGLADSAEAQIRAVATSAVREALNRQDFIRRVKTDTGIRVEVASGLEEARYIYLGILQALPVFDKRILLLDIGGGSTEFLVGLKRDVFYDDSLKLGAIRLTLRFFGDGEVSQKSVKECRRYIRGMMSQVIREIKNIGFETVVGSSGTVLNIANVINIKKNGEDKSRLNNFTFTDGELYETVDKIIDAKSTKQRSKIPGVDEDRADILPAGALILEQIFKELKLKEMTVSEFALREGILLDTYEKKFRLKKPDHLNDIRYKSVLHMAENFRYEREHAEHTAGLALSIFDQTKNLHKLGSAEREYLEAATVLHEIGNFISHTQHHRHTYYLIRNAELLGFTEDEKEIIANTARYHRKSHPKPKHAEYSKLNDEDQAVVKKLAAILRIADGLDRTHTSAVGEVIVKQDDGAVSFLLKKKANENSNQLELEIWGAEQKKKLFEDTFKVNVNFEIYENNLLTIP